MVFVSRAYLSNLDDSDRQTFLRANVPLGYHPTTGDTFFVPDTDRYAGSYVIGVQGVGKSGLLENLIHWDAEAGNAIVVIDPHGDLTNNCIAALPPERLDHTYLLNMEDEAYPFGVNLFALSGTLKTDMQRTQTVDRIMHIFEVLWDDVLSQQNLPRYVRAATITFLANPGTTLVDMHRFLLDSSFRQHLLKNVTDPTIRQFWRTQFDDLGEKESAKRVMPLVNRLELLFMGRHLVSNIVGQRRTTISFRRAIERKEIIFIKLPVKIVSQDARLIGTIIISQISAAVFSFADIPEAQRPGVSLYVDEAQNFTTTDFSELFTEGRKFGVKVTVAHQYRNQLPKYLRDSTMTARTKVCFQVTPDDGSELAHLFPATQEATISADNLDPHPIKYLLNYGADDPMVREFIAIYLRPLNLHKRGGKIDIQGKVWTWDFWHGVDRKEVYVADPTPYLDSVLYDAMRTGNEIVPVPYDAVAGYANSGRGFFPEIRKYYGSRDVTVGLQPPPYLIVPGPNGDRWTRPPENAYEQFIHFIFHLRVTIKWLIAHPIGKATQAGPLDVAHMLVELPRRSAFIRSGTDIGVMYTNTTPLRLSGEALTQRSIIIRDQTRERYCHPRQQIEQALLAEEEVYEVAHNTEELSPELRESLEAVADMPPSRWEDVP